MSSSDAMMPRVLEDLGVAVAEERHGFLYTLSKRLSNGHVLVDDDDGSSRLCVDEGNIRALQQITLDPILREKILDSLQPRNSAVLRAAFPKFLSFQNSSAQDIDEIAEEFGVTTEKILQTFENAWSEIGAVVRGYALSLREDQKLDVDLSFVSIDPVESD